MGIQFQSGLLAKSDTIWYQILGGGGELGVGGLSTKHSDLPNQAKNGCYYSCFSVSKQIQDIGLCLSFRFLKLFLSLKDMIPVPYKVPPSLVMIDKGCVALLSTYTVICENALWSLNGVHLCSLPYYGFSFLQPPLRDQPPWRFWNEPASDGIAAKDTHMTYTNIVLHHITDVNLSYIIGFCIIG